jgi:hypothetical protein
LPSELAPLSIFVVDHLPGLVREEECDIGYVGFLPTKLS